MLSALAVFAFALQGEPPQDDLRTKEAEIIQQRAFAAIDEAGEREGAARIKAWERAVAEFRKVAKEYEDTRFYGMCHFNLGHILGNQLARHEEAIAELKLLIASKVDDRDSTGALMHPHRNYRYHSFHLIASSHLALTRPGLAIEAVLNARSAYVADCVTCQRQMLASTQRRLAALAREIAPGIEDTDVAAVLEPPAHADAQPPATDPKAMRFLAALESRLRQAANADEARRVLRVLAEEFPATAEGKAAAKELSRTAKDAKE